MKEKLRSRPTSAMVSGKLCYAPEGDYFVVCSFDKNHVLLRSRMPYHIVKCKKNFPNHNKMQCPYDATEYIDPKDFRDHILKCESAEQSCTSRELYELAWLKETGNLCNSERDPPPYHHSSAPEVTEDWGAGNTNTPESPVQPPVQGGVYTSAPEIAEDSDDEDFSLRGVGRGLSIKKEERGLGRAQKLARLLKQYEEMKASGKLSITSSSSRSSVSNTSTGQFDDV